MSRTSALELLAVPGLPMVKPGDDLAALIAEGFARGGIEPRAGDVLVVAQKIVSKAEGRSVDLATVTPSARAIELAAEIQKDPRLVELILSEFGARGALAAQRADRRAPAGLRHGQCRHRPVQCRAERRRRTRPAAAGRSRRQRRGAAGRLAGLFGVPPAVIITDSFGRPWRRGTAGVAIGAAGLPALLDLRGKPDLFGRILQVSISGFADEIAAAASLVMGQGDEAQPVVLVRGLSWQAPANPAAEPRAAGKRGPVSMSRGLVVALSGGIGGAKLALGLSRVLPPDELLIVANTGDDFEHLGLSISPDIDTLTYALAGLDNPEHGWGRRDETWSFMETLGALGGETWFRLGDRDLALHVERTRRLRAGETLSADHRRRLPPSRHRDPRAADERRSACARACARDGGWIDFQDYFVRQQCRPVVRELAFDGAGRGARRSRTSWRRCERRAARGGDLPVQPLHQHRADPGRAGHARRHRRLRRAGDRRLADHRRPGGEGADGEDVRRARHCRRAPPRSPRATAICSPAMSWSRPMTPRASRAKVSRRADPDATLEDKSALARAVLAAADSLR